MTEEDTQQGEKLGATYFCEVCKALQNLANIFFLKMDISTVMKRTENNERSKDAHLQDKIFSWPKFNKILRNSQFLGPFWPFSTSINVKKAELLQKGPKKYLFHAYSRPSQPLGRV